MKITRNKSSLQDQLAKMLQAGKENVDKTTDNEAIEPSTQNAPLRANAQAFTEKSEAEPNQEKEVVPSAQPQEPQQTPTEEPSIEEEEVEVPKTRTYRPRTTPARPRPRKQEEAPRLNASQRHEVPDRNTKFAGEPIKSVGCRMHNRSTPGWFNTRPSTIRSSTASRSTTSSSRPWTSISAR